MIILRQKEFGSKVKEIKYLRQLGKNLGKSEQEIQKLIAENAELRHLEAMRVQGIRKKAAEKLSMYKDNPKFPDKMKKILRDSEYKKTLGNASHDASIGYVGDYANPVGSQGMYKRGNLVGKLDKSASKIDVRRYEKLQEKGLIPLS